MKTLLKYLLSVVAVLVFWNCVGASPDVAEDPSSSMSFEEAACQTDISESQSELCLPRQASFANSQRVQTSARRTSGAGRSNIEFTKSGKVINADIRYFIQNKSVIVHSSLMEPAHRLLCLGRLII